MKTLEIWTWHIARIVLSMQATTDKHWCRCVRGWVSTNWIVVFENASANTSVCSVHVDRFRLRVEKDLKTLVVVGVDREKMCISTRRGRGSSVYFVEDKRNPSEGSWIVWTWDIELELPTSKACATGTSAWGRVHSRRILPRRVNVGVGKQEDVQAVQDFSSGGTTISLVG